MYPPVCIMNEEEQCTFLFSSDFICDSVTSNHLQIKDMFSCGIPSLEPCTMIVFYWNFTRLFQNGIAIMMLNSVKTKGGIYLKTAFLENPASRGGRRTHILSLRTQLWDLFLRISSGRALDLRFFFFRYTIATWKGLGMILSSSPDSLDTILVSPGLHHEQGRTTHTLNSLPTNVWIYYFEKPPDQRYILITFNWNLTRLSQNESLNIRSKLK